MYHTKRKLRLHKILLIICQTSQLEENKTIVSFLPIDTVRFLNLCCVNWNLYIICESFNFSHASTHKSKFEVHPRYIAIIERFSNKTNLNAKTSDSSQ